MVYSETNIESRVPLQTKTRSLPKDTKRVRQKMDVIKMNVYLLSKKEHIKCLELPPEFNPDMIDNIQVKTMKDSTSCDQSKYRHTTV